MKTSVAICTYNGEKYIAEQLNSIIHQTRKVDEIIVCDDRSSDNTVSIAEEILSKSGIDYKVIVNEETLRVVRNFEKAFSLCSGDVIFSSDQDDIWKPNKVERIMYYFESNENLNMVATNADLIDGENNIMNLNLRESVVFDVKHEEYDMLDNLLNRCCITGATMAIKKSFSDTYFKVSKYLLHDGWLALIAAATDSLLYLDENLISYRLHGNNVCGVGDVDILKSGTNEKLFKKRNQLLRKKVLTAPFYYEDLAKQKSETFEEIDLELSSINNINEKNIKKIIDCVDFWNGRKYIKEMNFSDMCKMRKEYKISNRYEKYTENKKMYYADLYFWLVYHIVKRKKK